MTKLGLVGLISCFTPLACILGGTEEENSGSTAPMDTSAGEASGTAPGDTTGDLSTSGDMTTTGVDDTGSTDDTGGSAGLGTCVDAINFEGNPRYSGDGEGAMPSGQPLLADPPLASYHLAVVDEGLAVETQSEIWIIDAGAELMRRLAGDHLQDQYVPSGACDDVRFVHAHGVAMRPSGALVVADLVGNGLVELSGTGADCTATAIAGNPTAIDASDIDDNLAEPGDTDGPGAQARFRGVLQPVAVGDDIYVIDKGNEKIKRIAGDADRTVSTLADLSTYDLTVVPKDMTVIGNTLYFTAVFTSEDLLLAVDLDSGAIDELHRGRGLFPEIGSSEVGNMYALANDGQDLLVATAKGYIFRLSTAAEPLGIIAGYGTVTSYPESVDVTMPIPVAELPIRANNTLTASLVRDEDALYFTGNGGGVGSHLWQIRCGQ